MNPKRNYFYVRQGWAVIAPIFGFSNFIMLIYMTLNVDVPVYVFAPPLAVAILVSLIIIGKVFREKQQSTDFDLNYFKSKEALISTLIHMKAQKKVMENLELSSVPEYAELLTRINTLENAVGDKK